MENTAAAAKQLWNELIDILSKDLDAVLVIDVWFKPLEPLYIKENTLYLASLTQSNIDIVNNYMEDIKKSLLKTGSMVTGISLIKGDPDADEKIAYVANSAEYREIPVVVNAQKPAEIERPMFNSRYTFDNFVVGTSNQYVYAAARSVADTPGVRYNPLFIYGGVGLGKTHLMQAIGNHLVKQNPELKVKYVTSERFMHEFIESIHGGNTTKNDGINSSFRERYRNVDVLMVDDIQSITKNAERTQEEFFHTFNDLYNQNKQIIITSDKPPREFVSLVDRLRSRFEWGLIADIQPPDMETRIAILKKKAEQEKCHIGNDVLRLIAEKALSNIRELEGLLTRVIFFATLNNSKITMESAKEALRDYIDSKKEAISIENIIELVCDYYGIGRDDILGKKKTKDLVDPRQICIYLITEFLSIPLSSIAETFNRDHTTIIHARDKISEKIHTETRIATAVKDLKDMILKQ